MNMFLKIKQNQWTTREAKNQENSLWSALYELYMYVNYAKGVNILKVLGAEIWNK